MTPGVRVAAFAILSTLVESDDHRVYGWELKTAIHEAGGDWRQLGIAAKALRDQGITIRAEHGPRAVWELETDPVYVRDWLIKAMERHLSETISLARAASSLTGPGSRKIKSAAVLAAVNIGSGLDITPEEIVERAKPLPLDPNFRSVLESAVQPAISS